MATTTFEGIDGNWSLVPEHLRPGLARHINHGGEVGNFLTAVLENDLKTAVCSADDVSLPALRGIVQFLYCDAPEPCWGSEARVTAWMARGGLLGPADGL